LTHMTFAKAGHPALSSLLWELLHVQLGCCLGQLKSLWWGSSL